MAKGQNAPLFIKLSALLGLEYHMINIVCNRKIDSFGTE